jgi:alkylation response protein AidB-like acyl-CoA dehydrogenase
MTIETSELPARTGGDFLLHGPTAFTVFTPEHFQDLHREMYDATVGFCEAELIPRDAEIETGDPTVSKDVLIKACEAGLASIEVPENLGGLELDKVTALLVTEGLAAQASFATTFGAHASIGMLPILYFGSEDLKADLLPKLCSGELTSCYALTEPGSGSDALAARTVATLNPAGTHYSLTGTKQFITNAGFADIAVVFAKVDGSKFSGFVVDLSVPGVTIGPPEHKMGIRGSNTCSIILDDAKVPVTHVLGEIGQGHKIAFNILNLGRMKLASGSLGGAKIALKLGVDYALERKQFGKAIATFGALKTKFSKMATSIYATETAVYRTAGSMDRKLLDLKGAPALEQFKAIEEFATEAAMCKVLGSECLGLAVDETVQVHGGYGFTEEYKAERGYRDARINRIYEGTNEINRMLVPGTLLKRAMKGQLDLMGQAALITADLENADYAPPTFDGHLAHEQTLVHLMKRRLLYTLNATLMKVQQDLKNRQELLMPLADITIAAFTSDGAVARAVQSDDDGTLAIMAQIVVREAWDEIDTLCRRVLWNISGSKGKAIHLQNLAKWAIVPEADLFALEQELGQLVVDAAGYPVQA